jgi:hypothetical protein
MFALKEWENHLSSMMGVDIKILDIGIYKGVIMEEFAKTFLKSNKNAEYYGIDMWKQSEDTKEINFDIIEQEATKKRSDLDVKNQITFIKEEYTKALSSLSLKGVVFNIIYVNSNYLSGDILYQLILSFNLLKDNGVMIIDDYLLDKPKLNRTPIKIIVDTLLNTNKDHINILYIGYQVIIKKVSHINSIITTTENKIINHLINKLNDYWHATDIREYSLFFKYKGKIPDITPVYLNSSDIKIRQINMDTLTSMKNIHFLYKYKRIRYINNEIQNKSSYLKLNKLHLLLDFNDYSLLYLINDIKINIKHQNNKNIYVVVWDEDKDITYIERSQLKYNLFFNTFATIHGLELRNYYNNIETLDELIDRMKAKNIQAEYLEAKKFVGIKSSNKTNLEKMYNIILVQILLLKHILKLDGSLKILVEENFIFINDFILLLNVLFEKVYVYMYSTKISKLSLRIVATGFVGMSDELYNKIYEAIINAKDKEIISLFNVSNTYINYEAIENNIFEMTKNIIKIIDKNMDIVEKNIEVVNKTIARRTLDDVYKYLIKGKNTDFTS